VAHTSAKFSLAKDEQKSQQCKWLIAVDIMSGNSMPNAWLVPGQLKQQKHGRIAKQQKHGRIA
jgi:hypothetical protein